MLIRRGAMSIAAARVKPLERPVNGSGCRSLENRIAGEDSARQGEGSPLGNMINSCAHEVYLGKRLVLPGIVEIG